MYDWSIKAKIVWIAGYVIAILLVVWVLHLEGGMRGLGL